MVWDDKCVSVRICFELPTLLLLLPSAQGTTWAQADKTISAGTEWLLERLSKMSVRCRDVITPPPPISASYSSGDGLSGKGTGGSSATKVATMSSPLSMEERSKAARKRATEAVQQNAKKFMDLAKMTSQMYGDYDDGEDDDKEKVEGDEKMREEVKRDDVPSTLSRTGSGAGPASPECIICREKTERPLGYVGFRRRSRVLDVRMEQEKPRPGVHLQVGTGMNCGRGSDLLACFGAVGFGFVIKFRFGAVRSVQNISRLAWFFYGYRCCRRV